MDLALCSLSSPLVLPLGLVAARGQSSQLRVISGTAVTQIPHLALILHRSLCGPTDSNPSSRNFLGFAGEWKLKLLLAMAHSWGLFTQLFIKQLLHTRSYVSVLSWLLAFWDVPNMTGELNFDCH